MHRDVDQQNISYSQQNILANSIRIARERISKNGQNSKYENNEKQKDLHNHTFSYAHKLKKQNSAAQAIKVLHNRIAQLEAFNITLTKQNSSMKKEMNLKLLENQSLRQQYSDFERNSLQANQKINRLQKMLKGKQLELTELQESQSRKDQQYASILTQKVSIIRQSQDIICNLESKVLELNKRIDNNQKLIVQMIKQLEEQRIKSSNLINKNSMNLNSPNPISNNERNKNSKSSKSKQFDNFPVIVDEPDAQKQPIVLYKIDSSKKIKSIRQSEPKRTHNKTSGSKRLQRNTELVNKQLKQKNLQLYNMLKSADRKFKEEQKIKNQYKNRFYCLKDATDSIIQQITRLPNNLSHKFKCLIVKVKKIQSDNLQCLVSHSNFSRNRYNSKSSGNSSKINSSTSKSRQKQLKMQDLSLTDNQNYSGSKSKQKTRSITSYLKSHSGKKFPKLNSQQNDQQQVIKAMNKKIRQQRKQLCQLHKRINEEQDKQLSAKLHEQLQQKLKLNIQLVAQLQAYKKQRL